MTFARELEAWRTHAGLSKRKLAEALGYTEQYVGQIELCKNTPSPDFADALDTFFKTNGLFKRLWQRIVDTRSSVALPPGFEKYQELEERADSVKNYSGLLINGLFQTERYARTVIEAVDGPDSDALVARRMARQALLTRKPSVRVWLILDEIVLRRKIGGEDVMREQLAFLLELSDRPMTMVQVIPFDRGYHAGLGGPLTILGFKDGPDVGYTECSGIGVVVEQPAEVKALHLRYDLIRGYALPIAESRDLIGTVMEEL